MAAQVTRERTIEAPAEAVWEALTDPEELAGWLADDAALDAEPGGDVKVRDDDGTTRDGWVEEVDANRRLAFWWQRDDEDEATRVEIELEEAALGTTVRVTESRPIAAIEEWLAQATGARGPEALALA